MQEAEHGRTGSLRQQQFRYPPYLGKKVLWVEVLCARGR